MQKCLLDCLVRALAGGSRSLLPEVKIGGEECEGEGTDTEGHVKTPWLASPKAESCRNTIHLKLRKNIQCR